MSAMTETAPINAERTGRRVEEILDRMATSGDPAVTVAAEELVRTLMDFYGAGLARMLHLLSSAPGEPTAKLLGDELVASLLVLHDLHPEDRDTRIARALDSVRDLTLELVEFEEFSSTLRVRARADSGCCGAGTDPRQAVEAALACFAPEVVTVEVETAPAGPTLLQIGTAPTGTR
ncbi:hypothetical protein ACWD4G_33865 [Streptomyces sp. NPDC002643]